MLKQEESEKVKQKSDLSEREKEIYKSFVDEINSLTKPNPNKPDLSPEKISQIKSLQEVIRKSRKEIQDLEKELSDKEKTLMSGKAKARDVSIKRVLSVEEAINEMVTNDLVEHKKRVEPSKLKKTLNILGIGKLFDSKNTKDLKKINLSILKKLKPYIKNTNI